MTSALFHWGPHLKKAEALSAHKRQSHSAPEGTSPSWEAGAARNATSLWEAVLVEPDSSKTPSNLSALHADNDFHMKNGAMRDMQVTVSRSYSFVMVFVLASIFLLTTMAITVALVIFFRKKNTVFALQKCEQDDYQDYEMQEIDTDVEYTSDSETETSSLRKQPKTKVKSGQEKNRGQYQLMVEALLEEGQQSTSLVREQAPGSSKEQRFYALTNMPPNVFHRQKSPKVNLTYTDSVQNSSSTYSVLVTLQDPFAKLRTSRSDYSVQYSGEDSRGLRCEAGDTTPQTVVVVGAEREAVLPLHHSHPRDSAPTPPSAPHQDDRQLTAQADVHCAFLVNEQEALLEDYFSSNYAEEQLFSD